MIHAEAELLLAAGAALDDLAPDEHAAWLAHRSGCRECAILEDELGTVLGDLALVVPERIPPPDLLAGIRRAMDAEDARNGHPASRAPAMTQVAARPAVVIPFPRARRSSRLVYAAAGLAAVFAFASVGLGIRSLGLQGELDRSSAQVAALQAEMQRQGGVMAAAMNPAHVTIALESEELAAGATAVVVFVPGTERSFIVADDLPATPSGHGYQLWYADEAGVHPLQTVPYDGTGAFVAPLDVDLAASTAVMLTLEESGGAQGEPGPQVVFGEL